LESVVAFNATDMAHEEIALTDQFYISKLLFTKFENHLHRFETSFRTKLLHVSRQHSNPENLSISLGSISDQPFGWELAYCPSLYTVQISFLISCLKEFICEFAHKKTFAVFRSSFWSGTRTA